MWNPFKQTAACPDPAPTAPVSEEVMAEAARRCRDIADIEFIGPVAVATLTVIELTRDTGVEALCELLEELLDSGAHSFVLDIQNVRYMDSACLGCLVEALNRMSEHGGRIALANTDRNVQYLFRMTRLDRVFPICSDVMAALEAVERKSPPGHG